MQNSSGGFTLKDLKEMPFDEYEIIIKQIIKIQKEQEENGRPGINI
jgi:hypothetical protein